MTTKNLTSGPKDIEATRRLEAGRKPAAKVAATKERQKQLAQMRWLLKEGTEQTLTDAMRARGMDENSPGWHDALEIWRDHQRRRR